MSRLMRLQERGGLPEDIIVKDCSGGVKRPQLVANRGILDFMESKRDIVV